MRACRLPMRTGTVSPGGTAGLCRTACRRPVLRWPMLRIPRAMASSHRIRHRPSAGLAVPQRSGGAGGAGGMGGASVCAGGGAGAGGDSVCAPLAATNVHACAGKAWWLARSCLSSCISISPPKPGMRASNCMRVQRKQLVSLSGRHHWCPDMDRLIRLSIISTENSAPCASSKRCVKCVLSISLPRSDVFTPIIDPPRKSSINSQRARRRVCSSDAPSRTTCCSSSVSFLLLSAAMRSSSSRLPRARHASRAGSGTRTLLTTVRVIVHETHSYHWRRHAGSSV